MKNKRGFTLVEALVIAVIVGILAAVAIPTYTGYVQSQRREAVNSLAQTAAAAADVFNRKTGGPPTDVKQLNLRYDASKHKITIADPNITVAETRENGFDTTVAFR
jgi:Tfp pilus assembly protein PilE